MINTFTSDAESCFDIAYVYGGEIRNSRVRLLHSIEECENDFKSRDFTLAFQSNNYNLFRIIILFIERYDVRHRQCVMIHAVPFASFGNSCVIVYDAAHHLF